jgi:hypothetical protein
MNTLARSFLSLLFCFIPFPLTHAAEINTPHFPAIFGRTNHSLVYFHSHTTTVKELKVASELHPIIEIDLAWAHRSFNSSIIEGTPYIGHPEEYYTKLGNTFPVGNVSLTEFQSFLKQNPAVKVLIDVKDQAVFPYLENFIKTVGPDRCIVHAFIKNWTHIPKSVKQDPHWYREDVDLFALNNMLVKLDVPLIANCRGFSNKNIEQNKILSQMIKDSKQCKSIVSLGLYYPGVPLPDIKFLKIINQNGYYAWVNGNISQLQEKLGMIKYIAMSDDIMRCTKF